MESKLGIRDVLLYIDLKKKAKKILSNEELVYLLYSLENYEEVRLVLKNFEENKIKLRLGFVQNSLVHFIEDFDDFEELKNWLLSKYKNIKGRFFTHQISLAKTREQAFCIIKQSEHHKINSNYWIDKYNSVDRIKETQQQWRKQQEEIHGHKFSTLFIEFKKEKNEYFKHLSLEQLKSFSQKKESTRDVKKVTVFARNIYVKEFAKRVAAGVCQLCENSSPFRDKMDEPFLEVHHVNYLSRGGGDSVENVVALCPNCHRKVHILELKEDFNFLIDKALKNLNV